MSVTTHFDVAVSGAGPAGSMAAYRLRRSGLRVILLDSRRFPRPKPCGGGVQGRAARRIPYLWQEVVKQTLHSVRFSQGFRNHFTRDYDAALVQCVLRSEFDELLLRMAQQEGVIVREGCRVIGVEPGAQGVRIDTGAGRISARYVIGADGANSVLSARLNSRSSFFWQAALYLELPESRFTERSACAEHLRIDWGSLPCGYAWVFPKNGILNIGVGGPASLGRLLRPYLRRFLLSEGLTRLDRLDALKPVGHQLPTLTSRTRVGGSGILLVGDAAGMVEPLTGDGISNAIHSAELAAESLLDHFGREAEMRFEERIRTEVTPDLLWARRLLSFSIAFPGLFYRTFESREEVWRTFCRVLRGEDSFHQLMRRILGKVEMFGPLLDGALGLIEKRRLTHDYAIRQSRWSTLALDLGVAGVPAGS